MKALLARLLLLAIFAGQVATIGITQAGARPMSCCVEAADQGVVGHAHCPPMGGPANSCCPDCPYLLSAMLPIDSSRPPRVDRPQIAIFPALSERANSRVEEPPVPPPRVG